MDEFEAILKKNQIKITKPRLEVFSILNSLDEPASIKEISKNTKVAERTSIYRTLELFTRLKIVEIINIGWKQHYELAEPFRSHHHHLICNNCGRIVKIEQPKLEAIINSISDEYNYSTVTHHVELRGICQDCNNKS